MDSKIARIVFGILLVDFTALTVYALATAGVDVMLEAISHNIMTITLTVDLCLALFCCLVLLREDARRRGESFWGIALVTMLTGSVGPLLYLTKRKGGDADDETTTRERRLSSSTSTSPLGAR